MKKPVTSEDKIMKRQNVNEQLGRFLQQVIGVQPQIILGTISMF